MNIPSTYIAAVILALLLVGFGLYQAYENRNDLQKMSLSMTVCISFAVSCLVFPYFRSTTRNLLFAVLASIRYGAQSLSMNVNGDIVYSMNLPSWLAPLYSFFLLLLYILGPLFASMFVLGFSRTIVEYLRFGRAQHVHVFSELNERSAVIAQSLYNKQRSEVRVFCASDNAPESLKTKARAAHALIVKYDETALRLKKNRIYHFYEIYDNPDQTLPKTAALVQHLRTRKNIRSASVRVFISHDQIELVRDIDERLASDGYDIKIRYVDESHAEAVELFHHMIPILPTGEKGHHYNLLFVGCGTCGESILRTAAWLMVLPESTYTFHVIDRKAKAIASRLKEECPEYLNAQLEAYFKDDPTGKNYDVIFHEMDTESCAFRELLTSIDRPDLAAVALKDDIQTHRVAKEIIRIYAAKSPTLTAPPVAARIRSSKSVELLKGASIYCFGSIGKHYDYDNLIHPELEEAAKVTHLSYYGSNEWTDEIALAFYRYVNYDSSFAQALTMLARRRYILASLPEGSDPYQWVESYLDDKEKLALLGDAEHDRWNAYQRINGWQCASLEQTDAIARATEGRKVKDDHLLLHPAIVPCEELAKREQEVDAIRRKYRPDAAGVNYVNLDRDIIRCLPAILKSEPVNDNEI